MNANANKASWPAKDKAAVIAAFVTAFFTAGASGLAAWFSWDAQGEAARAVITAGEAAARSAEAERLLTKHIADLEHQIKQANLVAAMLTSAEKRIGDTNLSENYKNELLITTMDVSIRTHLAAYEGKKEALNLANTLPYRLALYTGNERALAALTSSADSVKFWGQIVRQSGDPGTVKTALRAVQNLSRASLDPGVRDASYSLLDELAKELSESPEYSEDVCKAATFMAVQIKREISALSAEDVEKAGKLKDRIRILEGHRLSGWNAHSSAAGLPPDSACSIVDQIAARTSYLEQSPSTEATILKEAVLTANAAALDIASEYDDSEALSSRINQLIIDLDSDDLRRSARAELARIGAPAVPALVSLLNEPSPSYRRKLGALVALSAMPEQVKLEDAQITAIVPKLQDDDSTVRRTAAKVLQRPQSDGVQNLIIQKTSDALTEYSLNRDSIRSRDEMIKLLQDYAGRENPLARSVLEEHGLSGN